MTRPHGLEGVRDASGLLESVFTTDTVWPESVEVVTLCLTCITFPVDPLALGAATLPDI